MTSYRLAYLPVIILVCMSPLLADEAVVVDTAARRIDLSSQPADALSKWTGEVGAAVFLPRLLSHDPVRHETSLRMLDAALIAEGLTGVLKRTTHSPRPAPFDGDQHAFPSGHTSYAFAIAAALSEREPRAAYVAYPLAAAIGWSRHQLGRHTWAQVAGGAVLGTYVGMRAGKGQWHIFGHNDSHLSKAAAIETASSALLDRQVTLWSSSF